MIFCLRINRPSFLSIRALLCLSILLLLPGCNKKSENEAAYSAPVNNETQPVVDQEDKSPAASSPEEPAFDGEGLSLQEIFEMERYYDIILWISDPDNDSYFGEIIRRDSEWLASYSGHFIRLNINEIQYEYDAAVFLVDRWAEVPLEDGSYRKSDISHYSISVNRSDLIAAVNKVETGEDIDAHVPADTVRLRLNETPAEEETEEPVDIAQLNLRELFKEEWPYDVELSIYFINIDYDIFFGSFTLRDSRWLVTPDTEVEFLDIIDIQHQEGRAKFLFDRWVERPLEDGTLKVTPRERHRFFVDRSTVIDAMNEVESGSADKAVIRVEAVSDDMLTPAQKGALAQGNIEQIKQFLDQGTQVNARDGEGITALMIASYHGQKSVVNMLIELGADINASEYVDGRTALIDASISGQIEMVKLLLDRGADINAKNLEGWTALMAAVENKHNDIVALLMERGAYLDSRNNDGGTALTVAFTAYNFDAMFMLQEAGAGE